MKRQLLLQLSFLFFITLLKSQTIANYVNNGSFEDLYSCNLPAYLNKAKYWRSIDSITGSPSIFSTCVGLSNAPLNGNTYQYPLKGNTYVGSTIFSPPPPFPNGYNRDYFRNRLKQTLQGGKIYCVKFYVNIFNSSTYGIDGFGAYFGDNTLDTITKGNIPLSYLVPQIQNPNNNIITDTLGWTLITGTFVATGNEKHMVLGNFKSDAATNTVLINPTYLPTVFADVAFDEVSCIPLDLPAYAAAGNDIWAIPGNTIYLGRPQDVGIDEACEWFKLPNTTNVIANAAGLTLTVAITTNTYMVKQTICGLIKYDTVVVHASGLGLVSSSGVENSVKIYPNPASEILNVELEILNGTSTRSVTKIQIINSLGQIIREEEIDLKNNTAVINTRQLANGVYVFALQHTSTPLSAGAQGDNSVKVNKRFVISR
jgi:hypothetical protein